MSPAARRKTASSTGYSRGATDGAIAGVLVAAIATAFNRSQLLGLALAISMVLTLGIAGFIGPPSSSCWTASGTTRPPPRRSSSRRRPMSSASSSASVWHGTFCESGRKRFVLPDSFSVHGESVRRDAAYSSNSPAARCAPVAELRPLSPGVRGDTAGDRGARWRASVRRPP